MRIAVHGHGVKITEAIRKWVFQQVGVALHRHAPELDHVVVRFRDLNGPKGGSDKECDVFAYLHHGPIVIIKERGEDLYAAVSQSAHRLKLAVRRRFDRLH